MGVQGEIGTKRSGTKFGNNCIFVNVKFAIFSVDLRYCIEIFLNTYSVTYKIFLLLLLFFLIRAFL